MRQPGDPEGPGYPLQLSQGLPGAGVLQESWMGGLWGRWGPHQVAFGPGRARAEPAAGGGGAAMSGGRPFREAPGRGGAGCLGCLGACATLAALLGAALQGVCQAGCGLGASRAGGSGGWGGASRHAQQCPPSVPLPQDGPGSQGARGGCAESLLSFKGLAWVGPSRPHRQSSRPEACRAHMGRVTTRHPAWTLQGSQSLPAARRPPHSRCTAWLLGWGWPTPHHPSRPPRGRGVLLGHPGRAGARGLGWSWGQPFRERSPALVRRV